MGFLCSGAGTDKKQKKGTSSGVLGTRVSLLAHFVSRSRDLRVLMEAIMRQGIASNIATKAATTYN